MTDLTEISLEELSARKQRMAAQAVRQSPQSLAERRRAETVAQRTGDGRIRMAATDNDGRVQLNGRVTPDVKNQVIEIAQGAGVDMSSVIEAALLTFFQSPDVAAMTASYAKRKTRKR